MPKAVETILVVDDDDSVRTAVEKLLKQSGYDVLGASDGEEALKAYKECRGRLDLLLTDTVMPGMNGRELAGRMTGSSPDIKVIYMSGYTNNAVIHHGLLDPGIVFLQKPVDAITLLDKIREILGA